MCLRTFVFVYVTCVSWCMCVAVTTVCMCVCLAFFQQTITPSSFPLFNFSSPLLLIFSSFISSICTKSFPFTLPLVSPMCCSFSCPPLYPTFHNLCLLLNPNVSPHPVLQSNASSAPLLPERGGEGPPEPPGKVARGADRSNPPGLRVQQLFYSLELRVDNRSLSVSSTGVKPS